MNDPSGDLQLHPVYSHQLTDGTVIDVAHAWLTSETDPGGVCVTTSKGEISLPADLPPAEAIEMAGAIIRAANIARTVATHGNVPDTPYEWTGETGPV